MLSCGLSFGQWSQLSIDVNQTVNDIGLSGTKLFALTTSGIYQSDDNGGTWTQNIYSFGTPVELQCTNDTVWVASSTGMYLSPNQGVSWETKPNNQNDDLYSLDYTKYVLMSGSSSGIFRSLNQGVNWEDVSISNLTLATNTIITFQNKKYVGTNGDGIYQSDKGDFGTWLQVNGSLSTATVVSMYATNSRLYAGVAKSGLYFSDNGSNWNTAELSNITVFDILSTNVFVFAATSAGVKVSYDGGVKWRNYTDQLSGFSVYCLFEKDGNLYAGTTAHGLWKISVCDFAKPDAAGTISGKNNVCENKKSVHYTITIIAGAMTYQWGTVSSSTVFSSYSITFDFATTASTITVCGVNACGKGASSKIDVSVTNIPQINSISGVKEVCLNSSNIYSVNLVPSALYSWNLSKVNISEILTTNIIDIKPTNNGDISVTAWNLCGSSTKNLDITVTTIPVLNSFPTVATAICKGKPLIYSTNLVVGALYSWNTTNLGLSNTSSFNNITISPTKNGDISVTAWNQCGSTTQKLDILVTTIPNLNPITPVATTICSSQPIIYSTNLVAGALYSWNVTNLGLSGTSPFHTINISPTQNGDISVTAWNQCGSSTKKLDITVTFVPVLNSITTVATTICSGIPFNYSTNFFVGALYSWNTTNLGLSNTSSFNNITISPTQNGDISVTAWNQCGSSTKNLSIIVISSPILNDITTVQSVICSGVGYTYTTNFITDATYVWDLPTGISGASNTNSIILSSVSSGNIRVTATNKCGSSIKSRDIVVTNKPSNTVGTINLNKCKGEPIQCLVPVSTDATIYSWNSALLSRVSAVNSVTFDYGVSTYLSGDISVTVSNQCGSISYAVLSVTLNEKPSDSKLIVGLSSVCQGSKNIPYSVEKIDRASEYIWSGPLGYMPTISINTVKFTLASDAISGDISVSGKNECGIGSISTLKIKIDITPDSIGSISGIDKICVPTSNIVYWVQANQNPTSYSWLFPKGTTTVGSGNSVVAIFDKSSTSGTITVTANNKCGKGKSTYLPITILKPAVNKILIKWKDVLLVNNKSDSLKIFQWYKDNVAIMSANLPFYQTHKERGIYKMKATDLQGCTSESNTIEIKDTKSLVLYPNPAKEFVDIIAYDNSSDNITVQIYDVQGRLFKSIEKMKLESKNSIDISDLKKGIYFVRISSEGILISVEKLLVEE